MTRIEANSKTLQKKFPEIYREFFTRCTTVVSSPGNFWWCGENAASWGGLSAKQNLPLRVYVGFEPIDPEGFSFGDMVKWVPSKKHFEKAEILSTMHESLSDFLFSYCNENNLILKHGYRIHVIFEVPQESGLAASGAFSAALATALLTTTNKIAPSDIKSFKTSQISKLKDNPLFDKTFRLAWQLECFFHGSFSTGTSCFSSLVSSSYPVAYFIEKLDKLPKDRKAGIEAAKKLQYFGARMDEVVTLHPDFDLDFDSMMEWCFDFGLIYSGNIGPTESSCRSLKSHEMDAKDVKEFWQTVAPKLDFDQSKIKILDLIKTRPHQSYIDALTESSLEVFYGLHWIFGFGSADEAFRYFARSMNAYHKLLYTLNVSSPTLDYICDYLTYDVVKKYAAPIGCKLTGSGRRGDVLFVAPNHLLSEDIDERLEYIRKKTGKNIYLDYASWIDGIEKNGVILEQYLNQKVYSDYVSDSSCLVVKYIRGFELARVISIDGVDRFKNEADICFDFVNGMIFIKGRRLTSKDLPSTSTTLGIFAELFKCYGKYIKNTSLPHSSYSTDRNEMQSKIISPLSKIIENEFKKKIPLTMTGNLTNFNLKIEESELKIRSIMKKY